jgi:hypothetical protein
MRMLRSVFLLFLVSLSGPVAVPAIAQAAHDAPATPIEIGAAASYDFQRDGTPDVPGGAGAVVAVAGNFTDHVAILTELAHSPRMHSIMAGGRLSTGFFREGGTRFPGRFFLDALAGKNLGGAAASGAAIQLGAGADIIVVPRGLALHWALDYLFTPSAFHDFAGARFSVGFVAGPHIVK